MRKSVLTHINKLKEDKNFQNRIYNPQYFQTIWFPSKPG